MRLAYAFLADPAEVVNGCFFVFGGGIRACQLPCGSRRSTIACDSHQVAS